MEKHVEVAIIGAGSAGLYAQGQVSRLTDNYVLIDGGELGTTCARVGCMPSKALIQVAEDFHRRTIFTREGIESGDSLSINGEDVLEHVQDMRDLFVDKVLSSSTDEMGEQFIEENAQFIAADLLQVGDQKIRADKIVIATGSSPIMPNQWSEFGDRILTTDEIFELEELPASLAVIGLGVIGMELGQAFHRLGVEVTGVDQLENISGISDPEINKTAIQVLGKEFPLWLGDAATIESAEDEKLRVRAGDNMVVVEKVLVCIGRRPNLSGLDLEKSGITLSDRGVPDYDRNTMRIGETSVYIAGDVTAERPLLHEAADEGRIAGYNAVRKIPLAFARKPELYITFSDPNIVMVGKRYEALDLDATLIGSVAMGPLGRALIMGRNKGMIRLYADKKSGLFLGAEMVAPHAEHLGHLLAWCLAQQLTVVQMVRMPFYHPVLEEALQPILRDLAAQSDLVSGDYPVDLEPL